MMTEIRSKIINTPKFINNKSKTITNVNKDVEKEKEQSSNTPSENFSFRYEQQKRYNNHGYYESNQTSFQKDSEKSEKYSVNEKIQSHTTTEKGNINHSMLNKRDEIKINNIIRRNINAMKKKEYKRDLMNINHIDLNKSAINPIQEKMISPKFIEKIKKKSSSKSQKKKKLKLNNNKISYSSHISKNNLTISSLDSKENKIINQVISNENSTLNNKSKYQSNIIKPSNLKKSAENNSDKNNIYGSIKKNEYRPPFSVIPAEKIHAKTPKEKMDIYLDNQYSLNETIKGFIKKQEDYMKKQDNYMENQKYIYQALIRNLNQLSGDVKGLKEKI